VKDEDVFTEHRGGVVRLAHLSVKEYLLSSQIGKSATSSFGLTEKDSHLFISSTCLTYLIDKIIGATQSSKTFPLLNMQQDTGCPMYSLVLVTIHMDCKN
jgi:hypothetical protein